MYLHIGNNDMVLIRNIIGAFDLEKIKECKDTGNFLSQFSEKDFKNSKTLLLIMESGEVKARFTNISVTTIKKRIDNIRSITKEN